jgi:hexosaminidase
MKQRLFALALLVSFYLQAQEPAIIPKPSRIEMQDGNFSITPATQIVVAGTGVEKAAMFLNDYLHKFYGFKLTVSKAAVAKNNIVLGLSKRKETVD